MASFGRPAGSSTDDVLVPFTDVDDIVEPRTLSSAEIQLLREEYLRLYGRNGAPNSVHHKGTANPGADDVPGGSNPETTANNPAENGGVKEAAKTTAPAAPKK